MTDQKRAVNTLKEKFNKIEQKMYPNENPIEAVKRKARTEMEPMDTSFIKVNAKKIKSHKKVLLNAERQLEKNKEDLKVLVELKDDNHYKLEKLGVAIYETKTDLANVEDSIKELQQDRISDETRLGKLKTQKVEFEAQISDYKRQKEILTIDYHNLLNTIYLKESELGRLEEELTAILVDTEKVEIEIARETRNLKVLNEDFEKKSFKFQKAVVENKALTERHKDVVQNLKTIRDQVDSLNQNIYKLKGDNDRVENHVLDLEQELSRLEDRHGTNYKEVEVLREKKTTLTRRRDEILSTLKALKSEHSKNVLELDVRHKEKIDLEKEINQLLGEKTTIENKIFSQKSTLQSLQTSINDYRRESKDLNENIKLNRFHSDRYESDITKLKKETLNLKAQYKLLVSEYDKVKNETKAAQARYSDAKKRRDNWSDKRQDLINKIEDYKEQIATSNSDVDQLLKEFEDIKTQISFNQKDIERYKNTYEKASKQVEAAKVQHDDVSSEYRKVTKERTTWAERVISREQQIQDIKATVENLKDELKATEQHIGQEKQVLHQLELKVETAKSHKNFVSSDLEDKKKKKIEIDQRIHVKRNDLEKIESENKKLSALVRKLEAQLPEVVEQYETLMSAIEGAKNEHHRLKSATSELKKEIAIKEHGNSKLEAEFERIHLVTVNLKKQNSREKQELQRRFDALAKDKIKIEGRIDEQKHLMVKLTSRKQQLEREKDSLENGFVDLQKKLKEYELKQREIAKQIDETKSQSGNIKASAEYMKKQIENKEQEIYQLEEVLEKTRDVAGAMHTEDSAEVKKLRVQLSQLREKKVKIQREIDKNKRLMLSMTMKKKELDLEFNNINSEMVNLQDEKGKLDKEIQDYQAYVNKKALEVQTMKSEIKAGKKANTSKRDQLQKLVERNTMLEKQIENIFAENGMSKDVVMSLGEEVRTLHEKNTQLAKAYEIELEHKSTLLKKVQSAKRDIERFQDSLANKQHTRQKVLTDTAELEEELRGLQETREQLLDEVEMRTQTVSAEKEVERKAVDNLEKLKKLSFSINSKITETKNATIIFTAANELIEAISENEFEDLEWQSKVDSSKSFDACRIRFKNMQTQYSEMKKILKPLVQKLSEKFKAYGFNIETRSKTSPGEVLEAIEFRMTIEKSKTASVEAR
jgi:chromosome segregation ATPase